MEGPCIRLLTPALVAVLLAASTNASAAEAKPKCRTAKCVKRVAWKQCSQSRPVPCIRYAAMHYRQPFGDALRVARCESGLNPYAVGFGVHRGLFQFNYPGTWRTHPYRDRNPFSARYNALAAMFLWAHGRRGEWQCR